MHAGSVDPNDPSSGTLAVVAGHRQCDRNWCCEDRNARAQYLHRASNGAYRR